MSRIKFSKGRFARFISSKGFYSALALCLAGAGIATWMAIDRTINVIEHTSSQFLQEESVFTFFPELEEVELRVPDVPLENRPQPQPQPPEPSEPLPSSSISSSYSEEPPEPPEQSEPPEQPAVSPRLVYVLPLRGDIVKPFSDGELVRNRALGDWRTHDGVDISGEKGADIMAAADGVIAEIRNDPLWGTVVIIDHADGHQTHYSGLASNVPVRQGESVSARQSIGQLEGVPFEASRRTHLHFAVKRDGAWINPLDLIG